MEDIYCKSEVLVSDRYSESEDLIRNTFNQNLSIRIQLVIIIVMVKSLMITAIEAITDSGDVLMKSH